MKKFFPLLIGSLLLINICGFLSELFELNFFIILLGFRFHFSVLIFAAFIFMFRKEFDVRPILLNKNFTKSWQTFLLTLLPILILAATAYLLGFVKYKEPEYFFELGLSSLIDLPIYFIWNLPQLIILFLWFELISKKINNNFLFLIAPTILLYKIIPTGDAEFNLIQAMEIFAASFLFALLFKKERNIYTRTIVAFVAVWLIVLLHGSNDSTVIKIFLASQYESWEGFLFEAKTEAAYISLVSFLVCSFLFLKKEVKENI